MSDANESARLRSLRSYGILDSPPEAAFDRLTEIAADLFEAPIALISLIDEERQWFKSSHGIEATETPRELAFCDHAVRMEAGSVLVVNDATQDERFADNPFVTGDPSVRFYAGAVLTNPEGANLGTLCVIDSKPRSRPSAAKLARLRALAAVVISELELRRARRILDEQQRLLTLAEHMSGVGHWSLDAATGSVSWSDEVYLIHGVTRESYSPNLASALTFYLPADQARVEQMVAEALATGEGFETALELRRADGVVREVTSRAECQRDALGKVIGLVGVFQDVTKQNQTLRAVRESEQRYRLLADHAGDVISRRSIDGEPLYISPAGLALTGYSPLEMMQNGARGFAIDEDLAIPQEAFEALRAGAPEMTIQYRARHRLGHIVWVESRLRAVLDAAGRPVEVIGIARDVTQRKAMEEALRQARLQAEAATSAKSEFLANMSHELRTPLTSIVGFADLAAAQPDLPETVRPFIDRVGQASQALLCIVNDILDFSKLEAGQVVMAPKPTLPAQLCRATLDLLTPQAGAKDLDLHFESDAAEDLAVNIDPNRVRQILLNLIGNAVKFTPAGRIDVRLRHDGHQLSIAVQDTGPGISPEDQARLFQRFSQVDGSLARQFGGTGLGLAICKGLIEAMGGELGLTSEPGRGSTFWMRIPAPPSLAPLSLATGSGRPSALAADGLRILVADDHPANRDLASLILQSLGAEVTCVENGALAVELAGALPFDVIMLDLRMPVMDGPAACRAIRDGDGPNACTPILAFTADPETADVVRNPATGFDAVVAKPIDTSALVAAVVSAANFGSCAPEMDRHVAS